MEGGEKESLRRFLADQKIASSWGWGGGGDAFWGILKHEQQTSYCLLPDTL